VIWQEFRQYMAEQRLQQAQAAAVVRPASARRPMSTLARKSGVDSTFFERRDDASLTSTLPTSCGPILLSSSARDRLTIQGIVHKLSNSQHSWRGFSWQARNLEIDRKRGMLVYFNKDDQQRKKASEIPLKNYIRAASSNEYKRGTSGAAAGKYRVGFGADDGTIPEENLSRLDLLCQTLCLSSCPN